MPTQCSDFHDTCKPRVANCATDSETLRRYNRYMMPKKQKSATPAAPENQWVADALAHAGISQAELTRRLFERRIISNNDRSIVNKMTINRKVTAREMFAIAEITDFAPPPLEDTSKTLSIPLLGWVSAGALAQADPHDEAIGTIPIADLEEGDWIALVVHGDSMDRISPPESIIAVNRQDQRLVPNACYVIADANGEATYKRYRPDPMRFEPVSTNAAHETLFPDQEPLIVGRVRRSILKM